MIEPLSEDARVLVEAVAEVLNIPRPAVYDPTTMEQHRHVLMMRAHLVQRRLTLIATGVTAERNAAYIREVIAQYPIKYAPRLAGQDGGQGQ